MSQPAGALNSTQRCVLGAIVAACLLSPLRSRAQRLPVLSGATALADARRTITAASQVPVRLPSYVPNANDPDKPAFLIFQKLDTQSYTLLIAFAKECTGEHWCEIGTMQGTSEGLQHESETMPQMVLLQNGIHANYIPYLCGSYCGDGELWWREGRWNYSIRMKAGKLKELLQLANSATATNKD